LAKRIVEGLGGRITFESRTEVGSRFAVLVPLSDDKDDDRVLDQSVRALSPSRRYRAMRYRM
jgi:hypothetical protein